jgi:hypothetical protein
MNLNSHHQLLQSLQMAGSQASIERSFFGGFSKQSARGQSEGDRSRFKSSALYNAGASAMQIPSMRSPGFN